MAPEPGAQWCFRWFPPWPPCWAVLCPLTRDGPSPQGQASPRGQGGCSLPWLSGHGPPGKTRRCHLFATLGSHCDLVLGAGGPGRGLCWPQLAAQGASGPDSHQPPGQSTWSKYRGLAPHSLFLSVHGDGTNRQEPHFVPSITQGAPVLGTPCSVASGRRSANVKEQISNQLALLAMGRSPRCSCLPPARPRGHGEGEQGALPGLPLARQDSQQTGFLSEAGSGTQSHLSGRCPRSHPEPLTLPL